MVKMEDPPKLLRIPKSECPDIWTRVHDADGHSHGQTFRPSGSARLEPVWTPICRTIVGKKVRENSTGTEMGESTELGMPSC